MMRNALLLAGLILLLLGCASTPESFALIPEPEPRHIPPSLGTRSGQCTPDQPIVTPGQTVMDDAADVLAAHVDIIEVSSFPFGGDPDGRVSTKRRSGDFDLRQNRGAGKCH